MEPQGNGDIQNPFRAAPRERLVFASTQHESCFSWLRNGVTEGRPLSLLIGESGTGKTTIVRAVAEAATPRTKAVFCSFSVFNAEQLLDYLVASLAGKNRRVGDAGDADAFIDLVEATCPPETTVLILVDEAQNLAPTGLDLLLQIADRSREGRGRVAVAIAGGSELEARVEATALFHSSARDAQVRRLRCLDKVETRLFVHEQMRRQSALRYQFSDAAIQLLHQVTRGVPLLVNGVAYHALRSAHRCGDQEVTRDHVESCIADLPGRRYGSELPVSAAGSRAAANGARKNFAFPIREDAPAAERRSQQAAGGRDAQPPSGARIPAVTGSSEFAAPLRVEASEAPSNLKVRGKDLGSNRPRRWRRMGLAATLAAAAAAGFVFEGYRSGELESLTDLASAAVGVIAGEITQDAHSQGPTGVVSDRPAAAEVASSSSPPTESDVTEVDAIPLPQARKDTATSMLALEAPPQLPAAGGADAISSWKSTASPESRVASAAVVEAHEQAVSLEQPGAAAAFAQAVGLDAGAAHLLALKQSVDAGLEAARLAAEERARRIAVVERLWDLAREQTEDGDHEGALASIEAALALAAGYAELEAVRGELAEALAEALERRRLAAQSANQAQESVAPESRGTPETGQVFDREQAQAGAGIETRRPAESAPTDEFSTTASNDGLGAQAAAIRDLRPAEQDTTQSPAARAALPQTPSEQTGSGSAAMQAAGESSKKADETAGIVPSAATQPSADATSNEASLDRLQVAETESTESKAASLLKAAQAALAAGRIDEAGARVEAALALAPDDGELLTLRTEIDAQRQFEIDISRLGAEAQAALADQDEDLAFAKLVAALSLSPASADPAATDRGGESTAVEAQPADATASNEDPQPDVGAHSERNTEVLGHAPAPGDAPPSPAPLDDAELEAVRAALIARLSADPPPQGTETLKERARSELTAGDYAAALTTLQSALRIAPEDPELSSMLAEVLAERLATSDDAQLEGDAAPAKDPSRDAPTPASPPAETEISAASRLGTLSSQAAALVENGRERMQRRDIAAARLYFTAAVQAGAERAATLLAATYDPVALQQMGVIGVVGDTEKALYWYEVALAAGDAQAAARIETLRAR